MYQTDVQYCIAGMLVGLKFGEWIDFGHKDNITSQNLASLSLVNHGQLAKFAKLFCRQTFPLHGM